MVGNKGVVHTARWANALSARGMDVHLVSFEAPNHEVNPDVTIHLLDGSPLIGYFVQAGKLRTLVERIAPDVVNPHYASGYGTLARLAGVRPSLLSVWGSDVYDFPRRSPAHRWWLRKNLAAADTIGSTSHAMARETRQTYPHPRIVVTPFGIDEERFCPNPSYRGEVVVGTVKTLSSKYGIDILLRAFAEALRRVNARDRDLGDRLRLEITGRGEDEWKLKALANELGLGSRARFLGPVPHRQVPERLNRLDIYAAFSRLDSESFGVAILEASACELPVVVSDADGLREVTLHERTGLVVPKESVDEAAEALVRLITTPELRQKLGRAGRRHVLENYRWSHSVATMVEALEATAYVGRSSVGVGAGKL